MFMLYWSSSVLILNIANFLTHDLKFRYGWVKINLDYKRGLKKHGVESGGSGAKILNINKQGNGVYLAVKSTI